MKRFSFRTTFMADIDTLWARVGSKIVTVQEQTTTTTTTTEATTTTTTEATTTTTTTKAPTTTAVSAVDEFYGTLMNPFLLCR